MADYVKALPTIVPETAAYWEAAKRHELVIQRCKSCWRLQNYPRALCGECGGTSFDWVQSSGKGEVYSLTRVHMNRAPGWVDEVPYVFALIQLNEGIQMISNVVGTPADEVVIGTPVEVIFEDVTPEVTIPKFKVAQ